jgi:hypothetical protein
MNNTLNPFFSQLTVEERQYGYFEHTTTEKFMLLYMRCLRTVISEGLLLTRPPDPWYGIYFYCFWDNLKGKVYKNNPYPARANTGNIFNFLMK